VIGIGICSFSFHRLLAAGKQDIFRYITDCKTLGCTQLDPWNAHLSDLSRGDDVLHAGHNPDQAQHLSAVDDSYLAKVKEAARRAELPFGCIAVDGAHVYEPSAEKRKENRARAYRWIDIAAQLGAKQIRLDAGGSAAMPPEEFEIIVEGFEDLTARCGDRGIELVMENHWGSSTMPANVVKIMEAVKGLGLLLDSYNWALGKHAEGWLSCAKYAKACHVKTFAFTSDGEELTTNVRGFIQLMKSKGYRGAWGVESVPVDGDEIAAARKTITLIKKYAV
jgi:sugar phosphate isomerase/epimerase